MASVNKVILIGNLGADPETRYLPSGDAVTTFRLATTDRWKDKQSGEMKEATEWHTVVFFGRTAEVASEYLKKGMPCYVEGALRTEKWQDKEGNDRYTTKVRGDRLQLLAKREDGGGRGSSPQRAPEQSPGQRARTDAAAKPAGKFDDMEDDIPF